MELILTADTGDTTEDVTGRTSGTYCVTITDCNGCSVSVCDTVGIGAISGCTDSTAANYDQYASIDDGSCVLGLHNFCNFN